MRAWISCPLFELLPLKLFWLLFAEGLVIIELLIKGLFTKRLFWSSTSQVRLKYSKGKLHYMAIAFPPCCEAPFDFGYCHSIPSIVEESSLNVWMFQSRSVSEVGWNDPTNKSRILSIHSLFRHPSWLDQDTHKQMHQTDSNARWHSQLLSITRCTFNE